MTENNSMSTTDVESIDIFDRLKTSKVMVVGAGGIGCELLKNLVLIGFKYIEVIDLDTIDVSNLNRQFLFHKQHVGQSKAIVAAESVRRLAPDVVIVPHHNSIISPEYDVNYFKQFTLVLNALDNRAARNHVNRLCLAADVPLIESGSSGFYGQVSVIRKGITECYECTPKPSQRTFPGCTIRNTPSEPIHCIVWAKHLFNQLFGEVDADEDVSPNMADPENAPKHDQTSIEADDNGGAQSDANGQTVEPIVAISTRKWADEHDYEPMALFTKLFNTDIKYLLSMGKLWKKRTRPITLNWSMLPDEHPQSSNSSSSQQSNQHMMRDQIIWTPMECRDVFKRTIEQLKDDYRKLPKGNVLVWDKDNQTSVEFVAACSNLRSYVFGIAQKSLFDVKSMAGNIIPAIATTNACVAGMIVIEALKIIDRKMDQCRTVFIVREPNPRQKLIVDIQPYQPNPKCCVCSAKPEVYVQLNVNTFTIRLLEEKLLKQTLNFVAPDVEIDDNTGTIVISSEEGETTALHNKTLSELKIGNGCRLRCDDYMQHCTLVLIIVHCERVDDETSEFVLTTDVSELKLIQTPLEESEKPKQPTEHDNDDDEIEQIDVDVSIKKRKLPMIIDDDDEQKRKRVS